MIRRKNLLVSTLVAVGLVVGTTAVGVAPAAALTNCTVSPSEHAVDAEEQRLLVLINEYRAQNGLNPLSMSPDVTRAAAWFSRNMADTNTFPADHRDTLGRDPATRLTECDVRYTRYAENIAAGPSDAQGIFNLWRNSPPHNANMLDPNVTLAGIARAFRSGTQYGWYWTLDLTAPPATAVTGSTWYSDGSNAKSGGSGTTVRAYAVGAFENVPYQLVLATSGCASTVAVLNPNTRFADTSGFISTTVGTIPSGLPSGSYVVCFSSTPAISSPTATGPVAFTLQ